MFVNSIIVHTHICWNQLIESRSTRIGLKGKFAFISKELREKREFVAFFSSFICASDVLNWHHHMFHNLSNFRNSIFASFSIYSNVFFPRLTIKTEKQQIQFLCTCRKNARSKSSSNTQNRMPETKNANNCCISK